MPVRTLAVVCPDWPIVATGLADVQAIVVHSGKVVACSEPARREGVRVGQRRRQAEALAGPLELVAEDPALEARAFEPVVAAVGTFTPQLEVTRPGMCSFPARGPARYFGGERSLGSKIAAAVDEALSTLPGAAGVSCRLGIADGPFAAALAAEQVVIVEPGGTRSFLASFPLSVLGPSELVELLTRLGIRTLGELGELAEEAVTARFGVEGRKAWHLACGRDDRSLLLSRPPPDLEVVIELESPTDRVDTAAFVAVGLAEELCRRLSALELACTRLAVEVETDHGETLLRRWRADRPLNARTMVDRVRWQLEGWLAGTGGEGRAVERPTGAVALLRLSADEVQRDRGRQISFFGEPTEADRRAENGLARVQGLLGHEAVRTAVRQGGRSPAEQVRLVPWGVSREGSGQARPPLPPWPGRLPSPSPLLLPPLGLRLSVLDAGGSPVQVSGRGELSAPPHEVQLDGCVPAGVGRVAAWAGPWPIDERWWDPLAHRRRARFQVVLEQGSALLLMLEKGEWCVEAFYD